MDLIALVATYGYVAVFVGTFLEGETVLVLAGFAAHRGYLSLPWVIAAALAGTLFGDQLYFQLGRWKGRAWLERRAAWAPKVKRVQARIERHERALILGFRFLYGLRTVSPFVLGMSGIPLRRFAPLNAVGAAVWAVAVACLGYSVGQAAEALLGRVRRYELILFAAIAAAGGLVWGIYLVRSYRERRGQRRRGEAPIAAHR